MVGLEPAAELDDGEGVGARDPAADLGLGESRERPQLLVRELLAPRLLERGRLPDPLLERHPGADRCKVDAPADPGCPGEHGLAPVRLDLAPLEEGVELPRGVGRPLDLRRDVPAVGLGGLGGQHHHVERGAHRTPRRMGG